MQALWCWRLHRGDKAKIQDITDEFVKLNSAETAEPEKKNVDVYRELQELQDELSRSLRGVFARRQRFVERMSR